MRYDIYTAPAQGYRSPKFPLLPAPALGNDRDFLLASTGLGKQNDSPLPSPAKGKQNKILLALTGQGKTEQDFLLALTGQGKTEQNPPCLNRPRENRAKFLLARLQ